MKSKIVPRLIPKAKPKAYVITDAIAFVPLPHFRAMWLKVHPSVVLVDCPDCGSERGVPCRRNDHYVAYSHYRRKHFAKEVKLKMLDHIMIKYGKPPSI